jgi:hypothetical protein
VAKRFGGAALALVLGALVGAAGVDPAVYGGLQWRLLGPFRGGWATMVTGVASRPDQFYFAAAGGGLWRSDDAGRTWRSLFDHGAAASVGAVAVAPSAPDTLYIGTGQPEPRYDVASGRGVFRSTDGGQHWDAAGLAGTGAIGRIWVSPSDPATVLVAAQGHFFGPSADRGIYRTTDGGRHWAQVLAPGPWTGVVDIASDPHDARVLFASAWQAQQFPWQSYFTPVAGPGSALYRSDDGGVHWRRLGGHGWPAGALGRIGLAVTDAGGAIRVYAAVEGVKGVSTGGLYRSDDGGAGWARVNDGDAFTSWYASRLTVAPDDPGVIYTVGQSIRRCVDGGAHCTIIKGAPGGDDYHFVWINPLHPDHMATGSDQGATVSVNGGRSWSSWYNQPTGQFYHLAADNRFPYWVYSGQQDSGTVGIASRSDYGQLTFRDWHPVGGDERDDDIPDPADPMIVYGSGLGGRVTKWDGHTGQVANISPWPVSSYGKRPTLVRYHYLWVTPLAVSQTGPAALYLGAQVLFASHDRGTHWSVISPDLTGKVANAKGCDGVPTPVAAKACGYGSIATIAPSPRDTGTIWVGADDGVIEVTHDGGAHWADVTPHGIALWEKVASLDVSAADGHVYAAVDGHRVDDFSPHVWRSDDGGGSWQQVVNGLPAGQAVSVVRADPKQAGLLYAGTDAGVYVSFDDGGDWQKLQMNLPTAWVRDLLVHGDDLIAATQGRAIWVLDDVSPLRQIAAGFDQAGAHLFDPAPAVRVHCDNNADTPLPPGTPVGQNPQCGAAIDYWLGRDASRVEVAVKDGAGRVVARSASDAAPDAARGERYFAKGWTRPEAGLSAARGMHRFVWNLRGTRPLAISYNYGMGAVWGRDTPLLPLGAWVSPGVYRVVLTVDGKTMDAPLTISEDPRVTTDAAGLAASAALSARISAGLARARIEYGQQAAVLRQLGEAYPKKGSVRVVPDLVRAAGDTLDAKPAGDAGSFSAVSDVLGGIESDLEAADVAPTASQVQMVEAMLARVDALWRGWAAFKTERLPALNAQLVRDGHKPVVVPQDAGLQISQPDPGEDLP